MMVPLNSLSAKINNHQTEILESIQKVMDSGWVILGPEVKRFEEAFAKYLGVANCIGVANGTDALELALKAFGIQQSDLVATVANAGAYSTNAILANGAEPYFMDVCVENQLVTLQEVEQAIKAGVKAVVATHLYGMMIPEILEIAKLCNKHNVFLLEDCAQAHGAKLHQKQAGSFGDASAFSFYPTKNLGALGDGGAVATNNPDLAMKVFGLRQYGWSHKYKIEMAGARNSRLDEIQAAILNTFLWNLDSLNAKRRLIAKSYSEKIRNPRIKTPIVSGESYVGHLYVIQTEQRDSLKNHLQAMKIASDIHYPIPDHRQPFFGKRYSEISLLKTEMLAQKILTLPCFPEMTDSMMDQVIQAVNEWMP